MVKQIQKAFDIAEQRNWDQIYFFYDIHETILYPDYNNVEPLKFYPYAKEALQLMTKHTLLCNILYTCSHPEEVARYQEFFRENDIHFESFVNENPLVSTTKLGCFDKKPYMNALFDDKAGFDAENDWKPIYHHFMLLKLFDSPPITELVSFRTPEDHDAYYKEKREKDEANGYYSQFAKSNKVIIKQGDLDDRRDFLEDNTYIDDK